MRVIVCGGRDYDNYSHLRDVLSTIDDWSNSNMVIAHGDCPTGVDHFADTWAPVYTDHEAHKYPANWSKYGNSAGPIRNAQMLEHFKPDLVVAFPGGKGTADMVKKAQAAGVTVILVGSSFPL